MDSGFRQLDSRERELLEKLLDAEFPGRDELRAQLGSVTAKQIGDDGTLMLRCASGPTSPSEYGPAIHGMCKDSDGMTIWFMLHTKGGFMHMLEIVKDDGSPIVNTPTAHDLVVLLPEDPGRKSGEEIV
jgi:hypothetical protein